MGRGRTAWHWASYHGQTETAQLLIKSSKDFGIDLNAKDNRGCTALHEACINSKTETVQMILKNWKEFGIDIKAQNNQGQTALDLINHCKHGEWPQIKKMFEKEYSQIDVTEPVFDREHAMALRGPRSRQVVCCQLLCSGIFVFLLFFVIFFMLFFYVF